MNPANWIALVALVLSTVGAILAAQHKLITKLFEAQAKAHEAKHTETDRRLDDLESNHTDMVLKVNTLETVCRLRQSSRGDGGYQPI